MVWVYFDASALVKRDAQEQGASLINSIFDLCPYDRMTCPTIGILEIISILVRKYNDGRLSQKLFAQSMIELRSEIVDNDSFVATPIDDSLLLAALEFIPKHNLNATDAIILRSAMTLQQHLGAQGHDLLLVTTDRRLARAAQVEGLTVYDPELDNLAALQQLLS